MLKEFRQNISTKESLLFCILGGGFVYFVCALPRILHYLFPPKQPKGLDIQYYVMPPPDKFAFVIGFSVAAILGLYFLNRLNLKNRLVHFSLLGLILAIGSGILTSVFEYSYYVFLIGDSSEQENFLNQLRDNWTETLLYDVRIISWAILFFILLIPFNITFLTTTSIIKKITKRNSLS